MAKSFCKGFSDGDLNSTTDFIMISFKSYRFYFVPVSRVLYCYSITRIFIFQEIAFRFLISCLCHCVLRNIQRYCIVNNEENITNANRITKYDDEMSNNFSQFLFYTHGVIIISFVYLNIMPCLTWLTL